MGNRGSEDLGQGQNDGDDLANRVRAGDFEQEREGGKAPASPQGTCEQQVPRKKKGRNTASMLRRWGPLITGAVIALAGVGGCLSQWRTLKMQKDANQQRILQLEEKNKVIGGLESKAERERRRREKAEQRIVDKIAPLVKEALELAEKLDPVPLQLTDLIAQIRAISPMCRFAEASPESVEASVREICGQVAEAHRLADKLAPTLENWKALTGKIHKIRREVGVGKHSFCILNCGTSHLETSERGYEECVKACEHLLQ